MVRLCRYLDVALLGLIVAAQGSAADFRVETTVSLPGQQDPLRNITLFHQGQVYDRSLPHRFTTRFDVLKKQFTLMDFAHGLKANIDGVGLAEFAVSIAKRVNRVDNRLLRFMATPHFTNSVDESSGFLVFDSDQLRYEVKLVCDESEPKSIVNQYYDYADWCSRLNATRPGGLPPQARVAINLELRKRGLPAQLRRFVGKKGANNGVSSQHRFSWGLREQDQQSINRILSQEKDLQTVSSIEFYHRLDADSSLTVSQKPR